MVLIGSFIYFIFQFCNGIIYLGVIQLDLFILIWESIFEVIDLFDVFIILVWSIKEECFKVFEEGCQIYLDGIFLEVFGNGEWIYFDIIYDVNGLLIDSYWYFVGLDSVVDYMFNLFICGNGEMLCISLIIFCWFELF